MKAVAVVLLLCSAAVAQIPDAPSAVQPPKQPGFWTVRSFDGPALRTNRQTLTSKTFILPEVGMWGLAIADAKMNGCRGNAPCGRNLYVDAFVPLAVVSVAHYAFDRWICRACSLVGVGIATERHVQGLITGVYP